MTRFKKNALLVLAALLALSGFGLAEAPKEGGEPYMENEWNFVDISMDAANGIPADAEGALGRIAETGVLRVATEPYFPPQEFIDPALSGQDSYVGADMAMARLIADRMGVRLEIVPMDFTEVLDAVADGHCDLVISALSYTPGRAARMTLSKGYHFAGADVGSGLMIRACDADEITGVESLMGRNIAAQSGSLQEALLAEQVNNYREFRRMNTIKELYGALKNGDVDAIMVDAESGMSYVEGNPEDGLAMVPGLRFTLEEQYDGDRVAARKGEYQLIAFVNGIIDELLASGQYREWFEASARRAEELDL